VPAVFAARLFPELLQIEGDRGARQVIERHGDAVQAVDWPEGAVDVDVPKHLRDITAE
jgi:molybdenum cofactor cytidylyltransferase